MFRSLREKTNWSKSFYCYLEAVCYLGVNDTEKASELFKLAPSLIKKKFGTRALPVEIFIKARAPYYLGQLSQPCTQLVRVLPISEVIYFFNGFHSMVPDLLSVHVEKLVAADSQAQSAGTPDRDLVTLTHLLLGTIYRELNDFEAAQRHLALALDVSKSSLLYSTALSYGHFEMASLEFSLKPSQPKASKKDSVYQRLEIVDRHAAQCDLEERLQLKIQWLQENLPARPA